MIRRPKNALLDAGRRRRRWPPRVATTPDRRPGPDRPPARSSPRRSRRPRPPRASISPPPSTARPTVDLPSGGGTGTPLDLTGTTASADVDFVEPAARATFAAQAGAARLGGEVIAVDGKTYLKTTLTGPLYEESAAGAGLVDPTTVGDLIDNLGDLLLAARARPGQGRRRRLRRASSATRSAST